MKNQKIPYVDEEGKPWNWQEWEEEADRLMIERRKPVIGMVFIIATMVFLITICVLIITNLK